MQVLVTVVLLTAIFATTIIGHKTPKDELYQYRQRIKNSYSHLKKGTKYAMRINEELLEDLEKCRKATAPRPPTENSDCQSYYESGYRRAGIYEINPPNSELPPFSVWCDFLSGHGWTVIQRSTNGPVNFTRLWDQYKEGFGDLSGEHWLGNDRIHELTLTNHILNIYMTADDKGPAAGTWQNFRVANETDNYQLTLSGAGYAGDLIDYFTEHHDGMQFSTADNDNDEGVGNRSCAIDHKAGWWYSGCGQVGLNSESQSGMFWRDYYPSSSAVMRITRE
ncbi:fibrinogen-like protein 1 [Watersipora subatra]|uniref:fibrinogen-like protein 1 n=1 Tax=Watersipora subatra TaxID=2589382 RepID=UPI00355B3FDA